MAAGVADQPLPPWLANAVGSANAPGGIMLPEFYNQLVAMHGSVMVFLAVVPLLPARSATIWSRCTSARPRWRFRA